MGNPNLPNAGLRKNGDGDYNQLKAERWRLEEELQLETDESKRVVINNRLTEVKEQLYG